MPSKTQSIVLGGVVVGVLVTLLSFGAFSGNQVLQMVVGCVSCLTYIAAGLIAVWHYTSTHQLTITSGTGAGMGAGAGVIAALIGTALGYLFRALGIFPTAEEMMERMREQPGMAEMTPEQLEQMEGMMSMGEGPIAIAIAVVVSLVVGAIGGAIGAAMFKKGTDDPLAPPPEEDLI